ncbi:hypothetical protein [Spirochaeta thermophila]|uniref:hypothetical protein n=1 Tax=Winmispira thermophila TaxID=154 RepID=UPI0002FF86BA|nr:hypothetical protein [Spirochaeta thermophila]
MREGVAVEEGILLPIVRVRADGARRDEGSLVYVEFSGESGGIYFDIEPPVDLSGYANLLIPVKLTGGATFVITTADANWNSAWTAGWGALYGTGEWETIIIDITNLSQAWGNMEWDPSRVSSMGIVLNRGSSIVFDTSRGIRAE